MKKRLIFAWCAVTMAALITSCGGILIGPNEPYTITVTVNGDGIRGTAEASVDTAEAGTKVSLTATPTLNSGFVFNTWTVVKGDVILSGATDNPATFIMPEGDVEVKVEFSYVSVDPTDPYAITVTGENGTVKVTDANGKEVTCAFAGAYLSLTATPNAGYLFSWWILGDVTDTFSGSNPTTFTMPEHDVEFKAVFLKGYKVTVTTQGKGTVAALDDLYPAGTTISLSVTPNEGSVFDGWTVLNGGVTVSEVGAAGIGSVPHVPVWVFTMPESDVELRADFSEYVVATDEAIINGVTWAACNVDAPGTFTSAPEAYGMYYQFNRPTGWSSTDPLTSSPADVVWDGASYTAVAWEAANDPCPDGWRVPALDEMRALLAAEKVSNRSAKQGGVNGRVFIDQATLKAIFLPAAGDRFSDGSFGDETVEPSRGREVRYWTGTASGAGIGYYLARDDKYNPVISDGSFFSFNNAPCPVRCVKQS